MSPIAVGMLIAVGILFGVPTLLLLASVVVSHASAKLEHDIKSVF